MALPPDDDPLSDSPHVRLGDLYDELTLTSEHAEALTTLLAACLSELVASSKEHLGLQLVAEAINGKHARMREQAQELFNACGDELRKVGV